MSGISPISQTQRIVMNPPSRAVAVINAGPMGPRGLTGPSEINTVLTVNGQILTRTAGVSSPISRSDLANDPDFVAHYEPVGVVSDYVGATAPAKYLLMDGSTVLGGQFTFPELWAKLPASMKSGTNIVFPDARGRVTVAAGTGSGLTNRVLGTVGGTETTTLTSAQSGVPAHPHSVDPPSTALSIADPGHNHSQAAHGHTIYDAGHSHRVSSGGSLGGTWDEIFADYNGGGGAVIAVPQIISSISAASGGFRADNTATGILINNNTATNNAAFSGVYGTVNIAAFNSANNTAADASASHTNMQPWIALNKIIRAVP